MVKKCVNIVCILTCIIPHHVMSCNINCQMLYVAEASNIPKFSHLVGRNHLIKSRFLSDQMLFQCSNRWNVNINWRDVQTKNVVNNVDMSCLRVYDKMARTKTNTRDDTKTLTTLWRNRHLENIYKAQHMFAYHAGGAGDDWADETRGSPFFHLDTRLVDTNLQLTTAWRTHRVRLYFLLVK